MITSATKLYSGTPADVDFTPGLPIVYNIGLSGVFETGQTVTASGTYAHSQEDGVLEYQWTRSDDAIGTGEIDISGETTDSYILAIADEAKYVGCRITPKTNSAEYGDPEMTDRNLVTAP